MSLTDEENSFATTTSDFSYNHIKLSSYLSSEFWINSFYRKFHIFGDRVVRSNSRINFFIDKNITSKKETQAKRIEHFNELRRDVLDLWASSIKLQQTDNIHPYSFIPLYVSVSEKIRLPTSSEKMLNHLLDDDYKEIRKVMEDLVSGEPPHNDKIASFIGGIEIRIETCLKKKDSVCQIENELHPYRDPKENRGYAMYNIIEHFQKEIEGKHSDLVITKTDDTFKLHRVDDNAKTIAVGDRDTLDCVRKRLNGQIREDIERRMNCVVRVKTW